MAQPHRYAFWALLGLFLYCLFKAGVALIRLAVGLVLLAGAALEYLVVCYDERREKSKRVLTYAPGERREKASFEEGAQDDTHS